jgi:hypothetical protein
MILLPEPESKGYSYRYPDGSRIWKSHHVSSKWVATWSDGAFLSGEDKYGADGPWHFETPENAAQALSQFGEGPVSLPCNKPENKS